MRHSNTPIIKVIFVKILDCEPFTLLISLQHVHILKEVTLLSGVLNSKYRKYIVSVCSLSYRALKTYAKCVMMHPIIIFQKSSFLDYCLNFKQRQTRTIPVCRDDAASSTFYVKWDYYEGSCRVCNSAKRVGLDFNSFNEVGKAMFCFSLNESVINSFNSAPPASEV